MSQPADILKVEGLTHSFGGLTAVDRCDWSLSRGVIAALIGPNGAGKSTLVNVISGTLPIQAGRVTFEGVDIGGWPSHRISRRGLIRTFQIARVFERMTVLENLIVAPINQPGESIWNAIARPKRIQAPERKYVARALELLEIFELYQLRNAYGAELSGGQKRLLELARAMMADPRVLVLDEPMAAINPVLIERIGEHLRLIRSWGVTVMMVEHNLGVVERICDTVTVMVAGRPIASGTMAELRSHPAVVAAYLGRELVDSTDR